jgi:hypothetical protein
LRPNEKFIGFEWAPLQANSSKSAALAGPAIRRACSSRTIFVWSLAGERRPNERWQIGKERSA